ncbi:MAG: ferredoxin--NADP reductase [Flavitalea sp.]
MLQPWRIGKVIRIMDETSTTRRFWIEVPELERFEFKPGQFVTLDLPIHEKTNKRWRSYSISSWPDGTNVFELVIVHMEGGAGTTYLFNEINIGSEIKLRGPQGVFVLPENIEKDLYFICTGTGIAPFRSMVHDIYYRNIPHKNIYLIFGCRKFADGLYGKELKDLEQKLEGFHYIPTYSREEAGDGYRTGYVHSAYEEIFGEKSKMFGETYLQETENHISKVAEVYPADFYLCGWKNMIDEAKQRIISMGYDKKNIHLELYG